MKHTVTEVKLKHGAKGLLVHVPEATVTTFDFNFRAGEYLTDDPGKWEVAHIMEHLSLGANKRIRKARTFDAEFRRNGAYCNASTSSYHVEYTAECAAFETARIVDLMTTAISEPIFLESEFEAEMGSVREELTGRSNNHFRHLILATREANGFINLRDQERLKRLKNVTLDDIRKHYKKTHHKPNMRFVVAGDMDKYGPGILSKIDRMPLAKDGERFELPEEKPTGLPTPLYIENFTVENMYCTFETFYPNSLTDKEWDTLTITNIILIDTFQSRIFAEAREKGLIYDIGGDFSWTPSYTSWRGSCQVSVDNALGLFEIIVREFRRVLDGKVEDEDIQAAKSYALGQYQRGAQTVASLASYYSGKYFFEEKIEDFLSVPSRINAVTKTRIVNTTRKLFEDKHWCLGILGQCPEDLQAALHEKLSTLWE